MISNEERQAMRHALGLDVAREPYRNRYIAGRMDPIWEELVRRRLAVKFVIPGVEGTTYGVTDEGIAEVGNFVLDRLEPSERFKAEA